MIDGMIKLGLLRRIDHVTEDIRRASAASLTC